MASSPSTPTNSPGTSSPAPATAQAMVAMVMEENHSFEQVIGNPAMPYLNSLAQQGALATQYYATAHPSIPNYFMLTTGAPQTMDNNFPGPVSADNLGRELIAAGKSWKVYAEDLPSVGYLGSSVGNYIKHHNPFAYFSDVINNPQQAANIVPFSQFPSDLGSGQLPSFSLIVPNLPDDAHSCKTSTTCDDNAMLATADAWLQTNIAPLLANPQFQKNGLLLIVFDESNLADIRHGGGRVPLVAVGPHARATAQSTTAYAHENTLKTICTVLGISTCPGAAASATAEDDLVH
jgi:phosphatidylinositol-3-phosphatase